MTGFTDIHSHFIYGVDDGARTADEMYTMLDAACDNGITHLYATPHVVPGMKEFDTNLFQTHLMDARRYCESRNCGITLLSGAEILYTPQIVWYAENHLLPVLEGGQSVLVEFSPQIGMDDIQNALEVLIRNGYQPIIAHVERYTCLMRIGVLQKLKSQYDVRFQVNAGTVIRNASLVQRCRIRKWFIDGQIDFIASDAHNISSRPFRMREAYEKLIEKYGKKGHR